MRISDWSADVCSSDLLAPTDNFSMRRRGKGGQPLVNAAGVPDAIAFTAPRETQVIVDYKRGDGVDADADSEDGDGAAPPSFIPLITDGRGGRSEERRVGKAWVSTCRSRGSPYHSKKN